MKKTLRKMSLRAWSLLAIVLAMGAAVESNAQFPPNVEPSKYCETVMDSETFYAKNYGYAYLWMVKSNFISGVKVTDKGTGQVVYNNFNSNDNNGNLGIDAGYEYWRYGDNTDFDLTANTDYEITIRVATDFNRHYNSSSYGGPYGPAYLLRVFLDENRNAEWESDDLDNEMIGYVFSHADGYPVNRYSREASSSDNYTGYQYTGYKLRYCDRYYSTFTWTRCWSMYEVEHTFDYTPTCDNPGMTRLRAMTWDYYGYGTRFNFNDPERYLDLNDACYNAYNGINPRFYPGYYNMGETEDYTINIVGAAGNPWPTASDIIKNQEEYGAGDPTKPKFNLTFDSPVNAGTKLKYKIIGPLPANTVVFEALADANDPNSTVIDIAGLTKWEPVAATPATSHSNTPTGISTGNGQLEFKRGGEYKIEYELIAEACGGIYTSRFTVANDYDLSAFGFIQPLTDKAPTYYKYPLGVMVPLNVTLQNSGLNDIEVFDATVTIIGPNGWTVYEDSYEFDSNNNSIDQVLKSTEKRNFEGTSYWKIFVPNEVGIYEARISVNYDFDQEEYNNSFSRSDLPPFTFEVAYEYENEVTSIETPSSASTIIEGRPFTPEVTLTNNGISVLSDFNLVGKYSRWNGADWDDIGTTTFFINDLPAGAPFNFRTYSLDPYTIAESGTYRVCYTIVAQDVIDPVAENDVLCQEFVVEEGMKGTFTVGTSMTSEKHFNTIDDAMDALFTDGVDGPITFLLVDAQYDIERDALEQVGMDFSSKIFGLGDKDADGNLKTVTWKPAPNRAMSRGGVTLNFSTFSGIGIKFGQSTYNDNDNAVVNAYPNIKEYYNNAGFIIFDGGEQQSLKVVNSVRDQFDGVYDRQFNAPFYLGQGSHDISIMNVIIENGSPATAEAVMLPSLRVDVNTGAASFTPDRVELDNGANGGTANDGAIDEESGYSAGIINRASRNLVNGAVFGLENEVAADMDTVTNSNNMFVGNDISGFGYGIVSIGYGPLVQQQPFELIDYSSENNFISDNRIYDVAAAGIFVGFEKGSEVSYNHIYDVNQGMSSDNAAGVVVGGDFNTAFEGYANSDLWIQGNEISNVYGNDWARGVVYQQEFRQYTDNTADGFIYPRDATPGSTVSSNIAYGLESPMSVAGIHVLTSRDPADILVGARPDFRMRNDLIVNNTVLVAPDMTSPTMYMAGLGIQDGQNSFVHNNAVMVGGNTDDAMLSALILYQGDNPAAMTAVDFNRNVYQRGNDDVDIVYFVEMEGGDVVSYGYEGEYNTLQQWRAWTGEDADSYEYMLTDDHEFVGQTYPASLAIKRVNGNLPEGSKLNNTGTRLGELFEGRGTMTDINGVTRGEAGEAYDIGAFEFRGRSYVFELEALQISSPSVYMATEGDFSDAQYIMIDDAVDVTGLIRNNGSLAGSGLDIKMEIFRENPLTGEFDILVMDEESVVNIRSNTNMEVSFGTADGMGDDFMPMSYYDLNESGQGYMIPDLFTEMQYNVTPRYKVVMSTESDEVNENNVTEATYRFYVKRATMEIILSANELDADISAGLANDDLEAIATGYNLSKLQEGLRGLGYVIDTLGSNVDEIFHFDRFDRGNWEERTIDYTLWDNMFYTDGHSTPTDMGASMLDRFQTLAVENFLDVEENSFKRNLVAASQDIAWYNMELANMAFSVNSNSVAQYAAGETDWMIEGVEMAQGLGFTVDYATNTNGDPVIIDPATGMPYPALAPLAPMPAQMDLLPAVDGKSYVGMQYTNLDPATSGAAPHVFAAATTSLTTNQVYLGADWRHVQDLETVLRGITDYLTANGGEIIPVELTGFDAREVAGTVSLTWETASEANSSHFDVERQTESGDFVKIGRVEAAGNSAVSTNYSFGDASVIAGMTYGYRLRMTDRDGASELSQTEYVTLENGLAVIGNVTPNPVNGVSTVTFPALEGDGTAQIVNSAGMTVRTIRLASGSTSATIESDGLAQGAYTLVVGSTSGTHTAAFTVR